MKIFGDYKYLSQDAINEAFAEYMEGCYDSLEHLLLNLEKDNFRAMVDEMEYEGKVSTLENTWNESPFRYRYVFDEHTRETYDIDEKEAEFIFRKKRLDEKYSNKKIA